MTASCVRPTRCAVSKTVYTTALRTTGSAKSSTSPTTDTTLTLQTTEHPVVAIDLPAIQHLLKIGLVQYTRLPHFRVQARRANQTDLQNPLITYVTDHHGKVLVETVKLFNPQDAITGIILLRYPDPINVPSGNPQSEPIYNEWYVPSQGWSKSYHGTPGTEWASYESKKRVERKGLLITPEVIKILGGRNGKSEVQPGWGGSMLALEGGLLVSDGSCIAPRILERYYISEGLVETPVPRPNEGGA